MGSIADKAKSAMASKLSRLRSMGLGKARKEHATGGGVKGFAGGGGVMGSDIDGGPAKPNLGKSGRKAPSKGGSKGTHVNVVVMPKEGGMGGGMPPIGGGAMPMISQHPPGPPMGAMPPHPPMAGGPPAPSMGGAGAPPGGMPPLARKHGGKVTKDQSPRAAANDVSDNEPASMPRSSGREKGGKGSSVSDNDTPILKRAMGGKVGDKPQAKTKEDCAVGDDDGPVLKRKAGGRATNDEAWKDDRKGRKSEDGEAWKDAKKKGDAEDDDAWKDAEGKGKFAKGGVVAMRAGTDSGEGRLEQAKREKGKR